MIVNGNLSQQVAIADRGLNFGDGHFTSIRIADGQAQLLDLHLTRLQHACAVLVIEFSCWPALKAAIVSQAALHQQGIIKVTITRGEGGRGYSALGCGSANWYLQHRPLPAHYQTWAASGIELTVCQYQLPVNPVLAGLKTLNRLDQVMLRLELDRLGLDDGLVRSTEGKVIETTVANLFWVCAGQVYTPSTRHCGVEGVMQQHLTTLLTQLDMPVQVGDYQLSDVYAADEVFISNAALGVVPVKRIVASAAGELCDYALQPRAISCWGRLQRLL